MRKETQQPPWLINFAKILSEHVLRIKSESHRFLNSNCESDDPGL